MIGWVVAVVLLQPDVAPPRAPPALARQLGSTSRRPDEPPPWSKPQTEAIASAKSLSASERYAEAAKVLDAFVEKWGPPMSSEAAFSLRNVKAIGENYRKRADALNQGDTPVAMRTLMNLLLMTARDPRYDLDEAAPSDPRIQKLLAKLCKVDDGFRDICGKAVHVKIEVEGDVGESLNIVGDAVVSSLNQLGLKSSLTPGAADVLALHLRKGDTIDTSKEGLFGAPLPDSRSCAFELTGRWMRNGEIVLAGLNMTNRELVFTETACRIKVPQVAGGGAGRVVLRALLAKQ